MVDKLGLDIGGVIMNGVREDREWNPDPPAIDGAFAAAKRLHEERFPGNCWLVSRCEADRESELMSWLKRHGFFETTGIDTQRVRFCRKVSEKARVCQELNLTHFVDDRFAVLSRMIGLVPHLFCLVSRASELEAANRGLDEIRTVRTWTQITDALLDGQSAATSS